MPTPPECFTLAWSHNFAKKQPLVAGFVAELRFEKYMAVVESEPRHFLAAIVTAWQFFFRGKEQYFETTRRLQ